MALICTLSSREGRKTQESLAGHGSILFCIRPWRACSSILRYRSLSLVSLSNENQYLCCMHGTLFTSCFHCGAHCVVWCGVGPSSLCGVVGAARGWESEVWFCIPAFYYPISQPTPIQEKSSSSQSASYDSLFAKETSIYQPLIGVWFCIPIFYHTIVPSPILNLPEKSSSSAFTASCEYLPCHETTYPVNLVITPIQLLLLFCLFLFNSIMIWFSIAAFYHTISHLPQRHLRKAERKKLRNDCQQEFSHPHFSCFWVFL